MPDAELKPNSESDVSSHLTGLWLAEEAAREPSPLRKHRCPQCTPNSPSMVCCNMVGDRDMLCTHGACTQISCAASAASLSLSLARALSVSASALEGSERAILSRLRQGLGSLSLGFSALLVPARRQGLGALGEAEVLVSSKKQKGQAEGSEKKGSPSALSRDSHPPTGPPTHSTTC